MDRILVSGASGPIGMALLASLEAQGVEVLRLVRGRTSNAGQIFWDPLAPLAPSTVSGFDAVVHLSGESVMGRWTEEKKKAIRESRVLGTRNLATALAQSEAKPRVFVCASAVGFYGNRGNEILSEESPSGQGFLPEVCREWEHGSQIAATAVIRTVNIRIGRVLAAFVDGSVMMVVLAFCVAIFLRLNPSLNPVRGSVPGSLTTMAGSLGVVAVLLAAAYEFLFVVYTGSTPGLRAARLRLAAFDGSPLTRRTRRWRVLASFLSAFSAGLGYLWCILDQDGLCWHDRITRTHVQSAVQTE